MDPILLFNFQREHGIRVRVLFVDNMSGPVLQMLGTRCDCSLLSHTHLINIHFNRYEIEPFFYSSSINWLPSRYQVIIFFCDFPRYA